MQKRSEKGRSQIHKSEGNVALKVVSLIVVPAFCNTNLYETCET